MASFDWHPQPPALDTLEVVIASRRRHAVRAPIVTAAGGLVFMQLPNDRGDALLVALVAGMVTCAVGWVSWRRAQRAIGMTATHLVVLEGGRVQAWAALTDVNRLEVEWASVLPESRYGHWFRVRLDPDVVQPPELLWAGGLPVLLIARRESADAEERLWAALNQRRRLLAATPA